MSIISLFIKALADLSPVGAFLFFTMQYSRKAVPTLYNGIQFRSKLEAQWAAFFDLVGWRYTYEPYEINGRLPDFIIHCDESVIYAEKQIIVEIKPAIYLTDEYIKKTITDYCEYPAHILFLSEKPFYRNDCEQMVIGKGWQRYLFEYDPDDEGFDIYDINMKQGVGKSLFDIGSEYASFDNMINFSEYRKGFIRFNDQWGLEYCEEIIGLWKKAGNKVQFKSYPKPARK